MTIRLWKEVLLPGRQRDRHGSWFRFSRNDILAANRNCNRMLSRGVPIPCVWEHQDVEAGDSAERKAAYAKFTFGHITGSRVNGRGALELQHEIKDSADVNQLLKTRFVSPKVYPSYSDPLGGEYRGASIAHVAATPTPVQTWQRPFSLSRDKAVYLSYARDDMADEKDDDKDTGDDKDKEPVEDKTVDPPADPPMATESKPAKIAPVIEALREKGFNIPDEVTDIAGLVIAIKAGSMPGNDDGLGFGDTGNGTGEVTSGGNPPMLMSDARAKGYAKKDKEDLTRRVRECFKTGRIDRPTAQKRLREVNAAEFSYTLDGHTHNPPRVLAKIEADEERPADSAWRATGSHDKGLELSATPQDPPGNLTGKGNMAELVEFLCEGLPAKR